MKKKIVFMLMLVAICGTAFAIPNFDFTREGAVGDVRGLDMPLVMPLRAFSMLMYNFMDLASKTMIFFAFLHIVLSCIKMWFGAQEIKKFFVDTVFKSVIFIVTMAFYPTVCEKCLYYASSIGINFSGGKAILEDNCAALAVQLRNTWSSGADDILDLLKEGQVEGKDNYISDELLQQLKGWGLTDEKLNKWKQDNGFTTFTTKMETHYDHGGTYQVAVRYNDKGERIRDQSVFGGVFASRRAKKAAAQAKKVLNGKKVTANVNGEKKVISGSIMQQALVQMRGIIKIFTDKDEEEIKEMTNEEILGYMNRILGNQNDPRKADSALLNLNPYVKDSYGNYTEYISPYSMLSLSAFIAELCTFSISHYFDEKDQTFKELTFKEQGKNMGAKGATLQTAAGLLMYVIKFVIYWAGIILCTIILLCEYIITILEYQITTALILVFLPCLFLDCVKSYAQNIMKLFISYFAKMMVIMTICFFVFGMFMNLGFEMLVASDINSLMTLVLYIFTLIMGTLFAMNAEKIANTITSGQPSMGMGELSQLAHGAMHAAHVAGGAAKAGMGAAGAMVKAGQGAVRGGMGAASLGRGMGAAFRQGKEGMQDEMGRHPGDYGGAKERESLANKAGGKAAAGLLGAAAKQKFGDAATKALTGKDAVHRSADGSNTTGFLKAGQKFKEEDREQQATMKDQQNAIQKLLSGDDGKKGIVGKAVDRLKKQNDKATPTNLHPTQHPSDA